ncbi:MAG: glutamate-5-semialdehyde dehydrogenase, partial [Eubacteriales bacterium]|nr:glutamate-5-semialdehyde dehydrogenase [Eubacteriales bacterium]
MTTHDILVKAKEAKHGIGTLDTAKKNAALCAMADALITETPAILAANAGDMEAAKGKISDVMLDRLLLTAARIEGMAEGIREVAKLPDPVGKVLRTATRPNGMKIERVSVPMGVIAIIYESRPNVTSDAASLALKAGSACILRCGKEAHASAQAIVDAMQKGLAAAGVPADCVQLIEDTSHDSANELMTARGYVDLLIPRGGAGLIRRCVENATVPVLETGTGICHVFVEKTGDQ